MPRMKHWWSRIPATIRKPLVLIVGSIFIIAAILTGWLPGPGGIPLFLIGIAILATEFEWAERWRDRMLAYVRRFGGWFKAHRLTGTVVLLTLGLAVVIGGYFGYHYLR